ncbi:hypothetical protein GCM10025298_25880 [Natronobiforma cellulositropha]
MTVATFEGAFDPIGPPVAVAAGGGAETDPWQFGKHTRVDGVERAKAGGKWGSRVSVRNLFARPSAW